MREHICQCINVVFISASHRHQRELQDIKQRQKGELEQLVARIQKRTSSSEAPKNMSEMHREHPVSHGESTTHLTRHNSVENSTGNSNQDDSRKHKKASQEEKTKLDQLSMQQLETMAKPRAVGPRGMSQTKSDWHTSSVPRGMSQTKSDWHSSTTSRGQLQAKSDWHTAATPHGKHKLTLNEIKLANQQQQMKTVVTTEMGHSVSSTPSTIASIPTQAKPPTLNQMKAAQQQQQQVKSTSLDSSHSTNVATNVVTSVTPHLQRKTVPVTQTQPPGNVSEKRIEQELIWTRQTEALNHNVDVFVTVPSLPPAVNYTCQASSLPGTFHAQDTIISHVNSGITQQGSVPRAFVQPQTPGVKGNGQYLCKDSQRR